MHLIWIKDSSACSLPCGQVLVAIAYPIIFIKKIIFNVILLRTRIESPKFKIVLWIQLPFLGIIAIFSLCFCNNCPLCSDGLSKVSSICIFSLRCSSKLKRCPLLLMKPSFVSKLIPLIPLTSSKKISNSIFETRWCERTLLGFFYSFLGSFWSQYQ